MLPGLAAKVRVNIEHAKIIRIHERKEKAEDLAGGYFRTLGEVLYVPQELAQDEVPVGLVVFFEISAHCAGHTISFELESAGEALVSVTNSSGVVVSCIRIPHAMKGINRISWDPSNAR